MPVVTKFPEPVVQRRWKKLPGEPDGPGGDPYTGYDEFGRTVQMHWYKVAGNPETFDPLVSVAWGYNRASLKLWRQDLLAPSLTGQDQLFGYDGLYQVTDRERGVLDVGHTGIVGTPAQQEDFTYDETGNWVAYQQRDAGVLEIDQTRENNVSNQITEIDSSSAGLSYDLNGNMLLVPTDESLEGPSRQLVWDAWNRLRIVKDDEDVVIAEYQYDGKTRRTLTESDGVVRHFYYNDQWRSVEERLDAASTPENQHVWHPANRWELLLRDRSTENNGTLDERLYSMKDQLDPVAVCDAEGEVVERYAYTAFGLTTVLDAEFEPEVASAVSWQFMFHGEFRDWETGWYNYGYRYYGVELGRWLSRDPIGEEGGQNLYTFGQNNPVHVTDLVGLAPSASECRQSLSDRKNYGKYSEYNNTELNEIYNTMPSGSEKWMVGRLIECTADEESDRVPSEFDLCSRGCCSKSRCKSCCLIAGVSAGAQCSRIPWTPHWLGAARIVRYNYCCFSCCLCC